MPVGKLTFLIVVNRFCHFVEALMRARPPGHHAQKVFVLVKDLVFELLQFRDGSVECHHLCRNLSLLQSIRQSRSSKRSVEGSKARPGNKPQSLPLHPVRKIVTILKIHKFTKIINYYISIKILFH